MVFYLKNNYINYLEGIMMNNYVIRFLDNGVILVRNIETSEFTYLQNKRQFYEFFEKVLEERIKSSIEPDNSFEDFRISRRFSQPE